MNFGRSNGSFGRSGGFGRGGGGRGGPELPKPVKVGEELDVTIEAVASKGDGIAKKDGFVIFVPGTSAGEKVRIKITEVKRTCAIAEKAGSAGASAPEESAPAAAAPDEPDEPAEEEEETPAAGNEGF